MKCFCGVDVVINERLASPELFICPSCGVEYKTPFFTSHKAMENVQIRTPGKAAGEKEDLNLIVLTVSEDDDHPAADSVEDEEMEIVQVEGDEDRWWPAEEFFLMVDVKKFKVIEGEL